VFADESAHSGMDDLSLAQENLPGLRAVLQREDSGLPRHRYQLNDVGQRQLAK
jgi:hypothetical protein